MTDIDPFPELASDASDDIAQVRALIVASHHDIVPELVQGESVAAVIASIDTARAAYTRAIASAPTPPRPEVTIPAGGNRPVLVDTDAIPTSEKIRRGLSAHTRKD